MRLALFDFDGTITTKDSMVDFIQYAVGKKAYYFGLIVLSPILVAYKLKLYPNYKAKERLLAYFFKRMSIKKFQKNVTSYSTNKIDSIVKKEAMERISWHKKRGDEVVVVSASMECWLKDWCDRNRLRVIATKLEIVDGKFTGKFLTKNCYGEEKVNRLQQSYCMDDYSYIYAYGDSRGDKELLAIADKAFYRAFRD